MKPEEKARRTIDAMLTAAGWEVQSADDIEIDAAVAGWLAWTRWPR
jgi:hypothetical protein